MKDKNDLFPKFLQKSKIFNILAIICGFFSIFLAFFLINSTIPINLTELIDSFRMLFYVSLFFCGIGLAVFNLFTESLKHLNDSNLLTKDDSKLLLELSILLPCITLFILYMSFPASSPRYFNLGHHDCGYFLPELPSYFSIHLGFIFGLLMPIFMIFHYLVTKLTYRQLCCVCNDVITKNETLVKCPFCNSKAHSLHFFEWLKIKGYCPTCQKSLNLFKFRLTLPKFNAK